jgi:hypothetical protein
VSFCNTHGPDDVECAPCQYADGTSSVDLIANVLTRNLDLTQDDVWVMDEDSPRSMAEKIVAALASRDTPTPNLTQPQR